MKESKWKLKFTSKVSTSESLFKESVPVKPMETMQFSVSCKNPPASIKHICTDNT